MATHKRYYAGRRFIHPLFFALLCCSLVSGSVWAEVTLDGTLGRGGAVSGPDYRITADLGQQVGANLFHSFGKFNVNTGESAAFSGPDAISNIISRVTGGTSSWIDGLLRSEITGANIYLLNPSGVIFGPNASMDVSGSFHVSTADYLKLGQAGVFYATNPEKSVLTTAPPSAFGFLSDTPKGISVDGSFIEVPVGKSISLTGGDLSIKNGNLYAPSGNISLISAASPGEAVFGVSGFETGSFEKFGTIETNDARTASERPAYDFEPDTLMGNVDVSGSDGGGEIFIRGGRFVLDSGKLFADTYGRGNALGIDIKLREDLTASNKSFITSGTLGSGNGGDILIDVRKLALSKGSAFDTHTQSAGMGGSLTINASDSVSMRGSKGASISGIYNNVFGEGNGGIVSVTSPILTMDEGARIETATVSSGNAGEISLNTGKLSMTGGAYIDTSSLGSGHGGTLNIISTESLSLSGKDTGIYCNAFSSGAGSISAITTPVLNISNEAAIQTATSGTGNAGNIYVTVGNLFLTDSGWITASSYGAGKGGSLHIDASEAITLVNWGWISNRTSAEGDGGNTFIKAPVLSIDDSGMILSSTYGSGQGGNISINASDSVSLSGYALYEGGVYPSSIRSETYGTGNAGIISIETGTLSLTDSGTISTNTREESKADAGNISINASDSVSLSGYALYEGGVYPSSIRSETYGTGNAGIISIETGMLSLTDVGTISTNAREGSEGNAGNISVNASDSVLLSGNTLYAGGVYTSSILSETYGTGNAGIISIGTGALSITDAGTVSTNAREGSEGDAGNISINASDSVLLSGNVLYDGGLYGSAIKSETYSTGNAGAISIETCTLSLTDLGKISTSAMEGSEGDGGNIIVNASDSISLSGNAFYEGGVYTSAIKSEIFGTGDGGTISIETGALSLTDLGTISTDAREGSEGNAGNIIINASDSVLLSGNALYAGGFYGSCITSETYGMGDGGTISIETGTLSLTDLGTIATNALEGSEGDGGNIIVNASDSVLLSGYELYGGVVYVSAIKSETCSTGNAGTISIETDTLSLTDAGTISTNAWEGSGGNAGNISINASDSVLLSGYALYEGFGVCASSIESETYGTGNAGAISIETGTLSLADAGMIATDAREGSEGDAGNISIKATDSVSLSGNALYDGGVYGSSIKSETYGTGNAGAISIETCTLSLTDAGGIDTDAREGSEGDAGNISIKATDSVSLSGNALYDGGVYTSSIRSETLGKGNAGTIFIETGMLSLTDLGTIVTDAREGSEGNAGNISIKATDSVSLSGNALYEGLGVGASSIISETSGKGNAGAIFIETDKLFLADAGKIATDAREGSSGHAGNISIKVADSITVAGKGEGMYTSVISSGAGGDGSAGNIVIETGDLSLLDYGEISTSTSGAGDGGAVMLQVSNLQMLNNASITAKSSDTGRGGNITIHAAESVRLQNGSTITTETLKSDGGNIEIKAPRLVYLFNSGITTSVQGGLGNGGNISIDPRFVALDNGRVIANAYGGNGGNIGIISDYFLASPESTVQASSQLGISGTVNITAPDVDLSGSLTVLPSNYLDATSLMRDRCAALSDEKESSLVVVGRGGMPAEPDDYLPSP